VTSSKLDFVPDDQLQMMALLSFQLWGRTVPCPISILETFNRNDHCMWQKSLVKNSSDLSLKQNNNFWHSSSFSPYQQRCHHYISLCVLKGVYETNSNSAFFYIFSLRSGILNIWMLWAQKQNLHYFVIIWPPNVPKIYNLRVIYHLHTDMVKSSSL